MTRADGRFSIPGMRVGGPYSVTVDLRRHRHGAFEPETHEDVTVNLGVVDRPHRQREGDRRAGNGHRHGAVATPVFSSTRTGAATSVDRATARAAADVTGRISDITRLTPQAGGSNFVGPGQPDEQHHGRRLVLQQLVRPRRPARRPHRRRADLARGDRAGAGQRRAVRRAPGQLRRRRRQHRHAQRHQPAHAASFYHRFRNEDFVGTEAAGPDGQPGHVQLPQHRRLGAAARSSRTGCSRSATTRTRRTRGRCTTFRANTGGEPVGGQRHARARVGPDHAQQLPRAELQVRHRPVRQHRQRDAGQAVPGQATTT